ncbi:MAG: hypothetical protein ACRD30_02815 [Bryobacteraceae bacterium]
MIRFAFCLVLFTTCGWSAQAPAPQTTAQSPEEAPAQQKKGNTFFAGTVTETTPQILSVARVVSGKRQSRTFHVTPETKIEGKLRMKVRVTVGYVTGDDGDTATLIVVRTPPAPKK